MSEQCDQGNCPGWAVLCNGNAESLCQGHADSYAARFVAEKLDFAYDEQEEKGIEDYMILVKGDMLKF